MKNNYFDSPSHCFPPSIFGWSALLNSDEAIIRVKLYDSVSKLSSKCNNEFNNSWTFFHNKFDSCLSIICSLSIM